MRLRTWLCEAAPLALQLHLRAALNFTLDIFDHRTFEIDEALDAPVCKSFCHIKLWTYQRRSLWIGCRNISPGL